MRACPGPSAIAARAAGGWAVSAHLVDVYLEDWRLLKLSLNAIPACMVPWPRVPNARFRFESAFDALPSPKTPGPLVWARWLMVGGRAPGGPWGGLRSLRAGRVLAAFGSPGLGGRWWACRRFAGC